MEASDGSSFVTLKDAASLRRLFDALNPLGYRESALLENLQASFKDLTARMTGECALPGEVEEISEDNSPGAREAEVDALRSRAGDKVSKMDKLRADMLDYQSASPRDVYSRGSGFDADIWRARVQTAETPLALRDLL